MADSLFFSTLPSATQMDSISAGALGRGIDRFMAKDYNSAIREFRRAIGLSPYSDNALSAFEYLANALIKTGRTSEAIETYRQAIKVFPSADGMRLNLGNLLYSQGRFPEAVEQYKAAVRINPTTSQNIYSLGQGYLGQGRYADAEAQFKRVIQLAPKDSGGYYALGQTYRKMGRLTEAQEQLERAVAIKNDFADAHYELGAIYAEQRRTEKAESELAVLEKQSSELYTQLKAQIQETSRPRILAAYSASLNLTATAGTKVSSLDSSLTTPSASKNFTVSFVFDKDMDAASVGNIVNWSISRSTEIRTGGLYNWGMNVPATEIRVSPMPVNVVYDPKSLTATITFAITQTAAGDGTIDPSHLVFKFSGLDMYGNLMDTGADEFNLISKVV